jgi:hypothetical protein
MTRRAWEKRNFPPIRVSSVPRAVTWQQNFASDFESLDHHIRSTYTRFRSRMFKVGDPVLAEIDSKLTSARTLWSEAKNAANPEIAKQKIDSSRALVREVSKQIPA